MIKTITKSQFIDEFNSWESRKDTFSYNALSSLYDYLQEYEEATDTKIELDIVALCCEYTEYEDLEGLQASYPDIESIEELEEHTQVIPIYNTSNQKTESFIIRDY